MPLRKPASGREWFRRVIGLIFIRRGCFRSILSNRLEVESQDRVIRQNGQEPILAKYAVHQAVLGNDLVQVGGVENGKLFGFTYSLRPLGGAGSAAPVVLGSEQIPKGAPLGQARMFGFVHSTQPLTS